LAHEIVTLIDDPERRKQMRAELAEVRARLGETEASGRAARRIIELLGI
jgi:hypothetical protein